MPIALIYLWAVSLLIIVGLLYLWLRLRRQCMSDEPLGATDLFAQVITAVVGTSPQSTGELLSLDAVRGPVTVMVVSGLLLVWEGQVIIRKIPPEWRRWVMLLMGAGGLLFLLGGQTVVRRRLPLWTVRLGSRAAAALAVQPWQLLLLLVAPLFALMCSLAAGFSLVAHHAAIADLSWALAITAVILGSVQLGGRIRPSLSRWEIGFTAVVFVAALFLRGVATETIPSTFSGDEGSAGLVAAEFAQGMINNWFVSGWFSFPSFYFFIQSIGIEIWGRTVSGLRLTSALAGALSLLPTYWLARSLFDKRTAVFATLYLAISHYHINISRIALNNIWDSLFGALALYGFWDGWHTGRRNSYVWCGVALGFGMYFYVSIRVLPLLFLLWAAVAFLRHRPQFWQRFPSLVLAAWISFIIFLPLGIFFYNFPEQFSAPLNRVTIMGDWLAFETVAQGKTAVRIVAEQMWIGAQGYVSEPLRLLYDPGAPLLLTGAASLFLLGLIWGAVHFDLRYLLLLLPMLAAIVSNGLSQSPPASQRYILAMPMVAIFVAVPLGLMSNWFRDFWPRYKWAALLLPGLLITAVAVQDLRFYFVEGYERYVLGGTNTLVATEIAYYLEAQPGDELQVYFFGFPRMGYYSLSTIPYLVPKATGIDIADPLTTPPGWQIEKPTYFIFLEERLDELDMVRAAYPNGSFYELYSRDGFLLYAVYHVNS